MSRIGRAPIKIPDGVQVNIDGDLVNIKGKLGKLSQEVSPSIKVKLEGNAIVVKRSDEENQTRTYHGLYRSLIANMVTGVSIGFEKKLELVGVGYQAQNYGQKLNLTLGYSHDIIFELPSEVKVETQFEKGKNPLIILKSHDKQLLGLVAAKIRSFRKPEPYKGKGVRFVGEYIRRKAGKTISK